MVKCLFTGTVPFRATTVNFWPPWVDIQILNVFMYVIQYISIHVEVLYLVATRNRISGKRMNLKSYNTKGTTLRR